MSLSNQQVRQLEAAIRAYDFPGAYKDFKKDAELLVPMDQVELFIGSKLIARSTNAVKDGLSNVLHWGYAQQPGRQRARVDAFRKNVTTEQLQGFIDLVRPAGSLTLSSIKKLGLPEFSNVSFVSKVLMFLDPDEHATLDLQILKMRHHKGSPLKDVKVNTGKYKGRVTEHVPITRHNDAAYANWNQTLKRISASYYRGSYRVVDVERGFFKMIQEGQLKDASTILADA